MCRQQTIFKSQYFSFITVIKQTGKITVRSPVERNTSPPQRQKLGLTFPLFVGTCCCAELFLRSKNPKEEEEALRCFFFFLYQIWTRAVFFLNKSISSREKRSLAAPRSVRRLSHILRQFIKKFQTKGKQKWQPCLIFISTGRHILQIRIL